MLINQKHRLSVPRFNAPYRGTSSREDFTNQVLAAAHDMTYLSKVAGLIGGDGQAKDQADSFDALYLGEGPGVKASVGAVGEYCRLLPGQLVETDLLDSSWIPYGNVTKQTLGEGIRLQANGALAPAGVKTTLQVEAGTVVLIRMRVRALSGGDAFAIGSSRINGGEDFKSVPLVTEAPGIYVDKRLYCNSRETIELNIELLHDPAVLSGASVVIEDLRVQAMEVVAVNVPGLDNVLKPKLERAEQLASFLRKQ